jgi:ribosome biogenesis protein MAK21
VNSHKANPIQQQAKDLWDAETRQFEKEKENSSKANREFISTVLQSGTVTDKVSALTLLIQESPIHTFKLLRETLIDTMAKKKSRREALLAVDSIKDLMLNSILPDRQLKFFVDQPVLSPKVTPRHLILWCFEDALKRAYFDFISVLEELLMDSLPHVRSKALSCVYELLVAKPEQEKNLLSLLVNKLGDLDKKTASKSVHLLSQLLIQHPAMKSIVIKEVEMLMLRPNISDKARYYGITFLNQIVLTKSAESEKVANDLISFYFMIFETLVKQVKERRDVHDTDVKKDEKLNKKKSKRPSKWKKKTTDKTIIISNEIIVDSVDSKMMAALLTGVNRAFPFSKLETEVFERHIDTLFMISHVSGFNTCVQALSLIFQVQSTLQIISDRFYRALYDTLLDRRLYEASKQSMYLNLMYRACKEDPSLSRTRSFVKRLVQTLAFAAVPFVCGSLFLLNELFKQKPGLWPMVTQPEEDDEDEVFHDVDISEGAEVRTNNNLKDQVMTRYDPKKRDPLFANSDRVCLWELVPFASHFHPTVALYAQSLLSGNPIPLPKEATNYDPLLNHTLTRFLDRFVYKAPKKVKSVHHGSSIMQPKVLAGENQLFAGGRRKLNAMFEDEEEGKVIALDDVPVNQKKWDTMDQAPPDEVLGVDLAVLLQILPRQAKRNEKR